MTGHLGTCFSWFPCVYKRMLRWFPRLQVATSCFSCSPPDLNFLDPYFIFMYVLNNHCHRSTAHLKLSILLLLLLLLLLFDMDDSYHRPFLPGISLEPAVIPPLRLQASHCSTFRIMCDVPSIALFYYYYYCYYYKHSNSSNHMR